MMSNKQYKCINSKELCQTQTAFTVVVLPFSSREHMVQKLAWQLVQTCSARLAANFRDTTYHLPAMGPKQAITHTHGQLNYTAQGNELSGLQISFMPTLLGEWNDLATHLLRKMPAVIVWCL